MAGEYLILFIYFLGESNKKKKKGKKKEGVGVPRFDCNHRMGCNPISILSSSEPENKIKI